MLLDGEDLEELQEGSIDALTCCNGLSFMHDHTRFAAAQVWACVLAASYHAASRQLDQHGVRNLAI